VKVCSLNPPSISCINDAGPPHTDQRLSSLENIMLLLCWHSSLNGPSTQNLRKCAPILEVQKLTFLPAALAPGSSRDEQLLTISLPYYKQLLTTNVSCKSYYLAHIGYPSGEGVLLHQTNPAVFCCCNHAPLRIRRIRGLGVRSTPTWHRAGSIERLYESVNPTAIYWSAWPVLEYHVVRMSYGSFHFP
jgi:hypothetical protein